MYPAEITIHRVNSARTLAGAEREGNRTPSGFTPPPCWDLSKNRILTFLLRLYKPGGVFWLRWSPGPYYEEDDINYLHTDVLNYAARIMAAAERHEGIRCGWLLEYAGRLCGEPATYLAAGRDLVADDTGVGADDEVQSGPQWLCREHLELILDGPPEDQPVFGHIDT